MLTLLLLAQEGGEAAEKTAPGGGDVLQMLMPFILIIAVFYFILIRPRQREQKHREEMLKEVKKYDKIITIGGIIGTITEVRDDEVTVKIDDSTNTRVRFSRGSIQRVLKPAEQKE